MEKTEGLLRVGYGPPSPSQDKRRLIGQSSARPLTGADAGQESRPVENGVVVRGESLALR